MTERAPRGRSGKSGAAPKSTENKPASRPPAATAVDLPWSVPVVVAEVPETGRHVELEPDEAARQAIAKVANAVALPRLVASFDLTRLGTESVRVEGRVLATVVQNCVVTLEPVESQIDETVDLVFRPEPGEQPETLGEGVEAFDAGEPPETLVGGTIDLGTLATEFLILGIDPYPRKADAVFDAPQPTEDPASHPFAALAALKKDQGSKGGTGNL